MPAHTYTTNTATDNADDGLVAKMLASTMQISNNNPTNTHTPHTGRHGPRRTRKPSHTRLILQDPTVCSTTPPANARQRNHNHHPSHTVTGEGSG